MTNGQINLYLTWVGARDACASKNCVKVLNSQIQEYRYIVNIQTFAQFTQVYSEYLKNRKRVMFKFSTLAPAFLLPHIFVDIFGFLD